MISFLFRYIFAGKMFRIQHCNAKRLPGFSVNIFAIHLMMKKIELSVKHFFILFTEKGDSTNSHLIRIFIHQWYPEQLEKDGMFNTRKLKLVRIE